MTNFTLEGLSPILYFKILFSVTMYFTYGFLKTYLILPDNYLPVTTEILLGSEMSESVSLPNVL